MLDADLPDLLPELRPYQLRAAYWMVQREKCALQDSAVWEHSLSYSPLSVAVDILDSRSKVFYNPFRYVFGLLQYVICKCTPLSRMELLI